MKSFLFLIILLATGLMTCVEPISFEASGPELLVVDGFISNEPRVHTVRLSRAADYSGNAILGLTNADVKITDDQGNVTCLTHTEDGIYATESIFAGTVGKAYTLSITTAEGEEYVSTPQMLESVGSIDSVYFAQHKKEYLNVENNVITIEGIQYYIDYTFPENQAAYLMWQWEATYQFRTRYHDPDLPLDCFVDENSSGFLKIMRSSDVQVSKMVKDVFMFVETDYRYWITYSLNVKQYTIGQEAYEFYHQIRQQKENSGSIFDPTPANVVGNIRNVRHQDEVVLGFFGAYGVVDKRTFVRGRDIPNLPEADEVVNKGMYPICEPNRDNFENVPDYCYDCRLRKRSTSVRPEYWQ